MASSTSLDPIWDNYATANACMEISKRALRSPQAARLQGPGGAPPPSAGEIDRSGKELERLFVVALWATFEREIIEYVQASAVAVSAAHPRDFVAAMNEKLGREIEWWRFDEILDLLKSFIDTKLIGQVRQIKKFRDGVVHRNPATTPAGHVAPDHAFAILASVLQSMAAAV